MVAVYLIGLSLLMITFISKDIDRYILEGISSIHNNLVKITKGNLDTRVEVDSTPEFRELSFQINKMVESLLDTTNKISKILEMVRVPIGVYEYNRDMKRVRRPAVWQASSGLRTRKQRSFWQTIAYSSKDG